MQTKLNHETALEILRKYNSESFHIRHGLTVEGCMKWFAEQLGYGEEKEFWGICGLLHDVDFERYPEEHCKKAVELLQGENAEPEVIHAVYSHGFGHCNDVEPQHEMEKVLFACDELTGLIWAAAKMRPSRSVSDMELKSLKKKFKDKRFAAGCSREIITEGAEKLGWTLEDLMERTILAMRSCETDVNEEMQKLGME